MTNLMIEIDDHTPLASRASMDWEEKAALVSSDPNASPSLLRVLAEALDRAPEDAVKDAEIVYEILLGRALEQTSKEWKWRKHPTCCWVCNSHNTRLVGKPGYGIVHDCLDCGDQFLVDGPIQWAA